MPRKTMKLLLFSVMNTLWVWLAERICIAQLWHRFDEASLCITDLNNFFVVTQLLWRLISALRGDKVKAYNSFCDLCMTRCNHRWNLKLLSINLLCRYLEDLVVNLLWTGYCLVKNRNQKLNRLKCYPIKLELFCNLASNSKIIENKFILNAQSLHEIKIPSWTAW